MKRPPETLEQLVARINASATIPGATQTAREGRSSNVKTLKQTDVKKMVESGKLKAKAREAAGRKYDWDLILGGQHVQLDAGEDYDRTGTGKDGKEFDRTDTFVSTIKSRGTDEGKTVQVWRTEDGNGIVVVATPMTPDQLKARDDRREAYRQALADGKAQEEAEGETTEAPVAQAS